MSAEWPPEKLDAARQLAQMTIDGLRKGYAAKSMPIPVEQSPGVMLAEALIDACGAIAELQAEVKRLKRESN